jgi:hypothetical protein
MRPRRSSTARASTRNRRSGRTIVMEKKMLTIIAPTTEAMKTRMTRRRTA